MLAEKSKPLRWKCIVLALREGGGFIMNKGTFIAIRNCVLGPILYLIVLWMLELLFDDVPALAVAFSVMGVMIVDAAHEAFRAGKKAAGAPEARPAEA